MPQITTSSDCAKRQKIWVLQWLLLIVNLFAYVKKLLKGTDIHVGAAISFPLGQTSLDVKLYETKKAIDDGADEIDYVVNIGKVKQGDFAYIQKKWKV